MEITLTTIDDNGNTLTVNQPATISLDKLSFNCKTTSSLAGNLLHLFNTREQNTINGMITLSPNYLARERGYRYVMDVLFRGEVYLQLAFCPAMEAIPADHVKVKICNHVLYESNWVKHVEEILRSLNIECYAITELHIALDSSRVVDKFLRVYYSPELQLVRTGLFGKLNKEKKLTTKNGFHFNKRVSDLYIAFYDKSLDYLGKSYIKAFHELNNIGSNVQRIEIRVRKISILKITGFNWQDLGNQELLIQIFKTEFQSRIVFNHMGEPTYDKSRNKTYSKLYPIDFQTSSYPIVSNVKNKPAIENIRAIKNTVKNIHLQTVLNPVRHNFFALKEMISRNNLEGWYKVKSRFWGTPAIELNRVTIDIDETSPEPIHRRSFKWTQKLLLKFVVIDLPEWKAGDLMPHYLVDLKAA